MKKPVEKRRTVWVNDEDWAMIQDRAKRRGVSTSMLIRASLTVAEFVAPTETGYVPGMGVGTGGNRIEFNPVPKPSKAKK